MVGGGLEVVFARRSLAGVLAASEGCMEILIYFETSGERRVSASGPFEFEEGEFARLKKDFGVTPG